MLSDGYVVLPIGYKQVSKRYKDNTDMFAIPSVTVQLAGCIGYRIAT